MPKKQKPRNESGIWLAQLGRRVAERVRDCLRTGSDSDVRDLLTRTEGGLDIHVQILRVRSDADSGTDMRAWIVLQQTVREKLVESSVELHPLSFACAEGAREQGVRTDETLAPHVEPRIEFAQCAYAGLSEKLTKVIAWAPDEYHERIRAQIEGLKPASQFVVTLFPPGAGGVGAGAGGNNGAWAEELPPPGLSKLEELRWKKRRQAADKASGGGGGDGTGRGRGDQSTIPMVAAAVTSVRPPPPCLSADPFLGLPRLPEFEQLVEKKAGDAAASTGAAQSGDGGGGGGDVNGGSGGDDGGGGGGDNDDDGAGDDSGSSPNAAVSPVAEGGAKGDGSSSGVGGETGDGNGDGGSSTDKGGGGGGDDKAQGSGGEGKKQLFTEWLKEVSPVVVDDCKVGPLYPYFGEAIPLHLGGDCDVSEFAEKLPAAKLADAIKMWGIGGSFVAKNLYSRLHFELGYPLSAAQAREIGVEPV